MFSSDASSAFQNDTSKICSNLRKLADIDNKETSDSESSSSGYENKMMIGDFSKLREFQTSKFLPEMPSFSATSSSKLPMPTLLIASNLALKSIISYETYFQATTPVLRYYVCRRSRK